MRTSSKATWVILLAAVGCGEGAPGEVGGTMVDTHVTEGPDLSDPWTTEELALTALVPQADGSFFSHPGLVAEDGSFRVPGVPPGVFYLKWRWSDPDSWPIFIVTDQRRFDL